MFRNLGVVVAAVALVGCAGGGKTELSEDFSDLAGQPEKSDQFSKKLSVVGSLDYGQTSSPVKYKNPPLYRAFKLGGYPGDQVDLWVRSKNGDAVAYLTDNAFKLIASNDDASHQTLDSHITATLPGNATPDVITYYIIFKDYWNESATFTVELNGKHDFTACTANTDCVAVHQNACCWHGELFAVNKDLAEAYAASFVCENPRPICAAYIELDDRVPLCNAETLHCEMVAPKVDPAPAARCGGIAGQKCDDGFACLPSHNSGADQLGYCVQRCGGLAGIQCQTGTCVDDPSDGCDPARGGRDCGGICVESCGGLAGRTCPDGLTCVDNASDSCDPSTGADCGGFCQ